MVNSLQDLDIVTRVYRPKEVEIFGVRDALNWMKSLNSDNIMVEMDALQVFNGLHKHFSDSSFIVLFDDVKKKVKEISNVNFLFTKRSAN